MLRNKYKERLTIMKNIIKSTLAFALSSCSLVSEKIGQADSIAHAADDKMHKVDLVMHAVVSPVQIPEKVDKK